MIDRLKWPATILAALALAAMAVVLIGGEALGVDQETRALVLRWAQGIGAAVGSVLLPVLMRDANHNGVPDVLEGGDDVGA